MKLKQTGERVTGTYTGTNLSGTMTGKFNGKTFSGTFTYRQDTIAFNGKMNLSYIPAKDQLKGKWDARLYSETITATRIAR